MVSQRDVEPAWREPIVRGSPCRMGITCHQCGMATTAETVDVVPDLRKERRLEAGNLDLHLFEFRHVEQ